MHSARGPISDLTECRSNLKSARVPFVHEVKSQIARGLSDNVIPSSEAKMIIICKHTGFYRLKLEIYDALKFSMIQKKVCGSYFGAEM